MINNDVETIQPTRPNALSTDIDVIRFYRKMDVQVAVDEITRGQYVLVEDLYSNGLQILTQLKNTLLLTYDDTSFQGKRDFRSAFREASHHLLVKVKENKLRVKKCPDIGWLKLLYPDISEFYISFPEAQGMNSSWQWYNKGVEIKALNLTLHPFYGTYFPTRFDHITLFDTYLKKYKGEKNKAIEIGVGSGVLSFQLIKNGFNDIFASDTNKNAIIGVSKESKRLGYENKIRLNHGDLFENCDVKADIIVFNPPWLLAKHTLEEGIDKAIYYEGDLFERFFEQAQNHLLANGKVVLIFSNLEQVIDKQSNHPIMEELEKNDRFKKDLHISRDVKAASKKTKRTDSRANEKVELWVLSLKN